MAPVHHMANSIVPCSVAIRAVASYCYHYSNLFVFLVAVIHNRAHRAVLNVTVTTKNRQQNCTSHFTIVQ